MTGTAAGADVDGELSGVGQGAGAGDGVVSGVKLQVAALARRAQVVHSLGSAFDARSGGLPAYVFSQLLGFSQSTADNWDAQATGFSPSYGSELARRTRAAPPPPTPDSTWEPFGQDRPVPSPSPGQDRVVQVMCPG
ncbi:hypothetical protein [Streptomyces naphthomycinicus]|uniref:hypothetical protein n=1 Tax=Streptomyces naphthomycinicus TaxID=2872625 RepID=UPI001CED10A3|nr:hypothetical protein [Streptomyces sp. TML10]